MNRETRRRIERNEARRHCDNECPSCLVHADNEDPAAPHILGPTTESEIELEEWHEAGEGDKLDLDVNFYCEACGVAWLGKVVVAASLEEAE